MLKTVSRSERRVPAARIGAERGAVLDEPLLAAVVPDEVRDLVHVGVRAGRDRREADGRQRREGRDARGGSCRARRGTRAPARAALDRVLEAPRASARR